MKSQQRPQSILDSVRNFRAEIELQSLPALRQGEGATNETLHESVIVWGYQPLHWGGSLTLGEVAPFDLCNA